MIGPPRTGDAPLDARVQRLSDRMERLCRELDQPYLPLFAASEGWAVWREEAKRGDGIHPNREGYALIHAAVLEWQPWRDWVA